jgi:hypothetical protein
LDDYAMFCESINLKLLNNESAVMLPWCSGPVKKAIKSLYSDAGWSMETSKSLDGDRWYFRKDPNKWPSKTLRSSTC